MGRRIKNHERQGGKEKKNEGGDNPCGYRHLRWGDLLSRPRHQKHRGTNAKVGKGGKGWGECDTQNDTKPKRRGKGDKGGCHLVRWGNETEKEEGARGEKKREARMVRTKEM